MNNIVKSQCFLMKRYMFLVCGLVIAALVSVMIGAFAKGGIQNLSPQTLAAGSIYAIALISFTPTLAISFGYTQRIQIYEIMAGFRPYQIMLGKALVYLPVTLIYLVFVLAVYLISDSSSEMIRILILFCLLCIRFTLCVIFLSPLLKESAFAPLFSVMVLMIMQVYSKIYGSVEEFSHSVFSFTCFGQCALLGGEITDSFMAKVIISSVIACVVYYLIGYLTLKKKIDLEPHPLR